MQPLLRHTRAYAVPLAVMAVLAIPAIALGAPAADSGGASPINPPNRGLITSLTTLIIFLGLLFILSKFAFAPIAAGLKKREDKIRQDIADAEAARAKAEATLRDLTARLNAAEGEARAITTQATVDAEKIKASIRAQAEKDAAEIREKNLRDIESSKNAAIAEIHEQAVVLSTSIAEKILKRNINADDQRELVRSSLQQLSGVGRN